MDSKPTNEYVKPEIVDHGTLAELTAHQTLGSALDATFAAGTPNTQLTHSSPYATT
jgi:hypothetical protein